MKCEQCDGTGLLWGTVSHDGGKTWHKTGKDGQPVTVECDVCNGSGDKDHPLPVLWWHTDA